MWPQRSDTENYFSDKEWKYLHLLLGFFVFVGILCAVLPWFAGEAVDGGSVLISIFGIVLVITIAVCWGVLAARYKKMRNQITEKPSSR